MCTKSATQYQFYQFIHSWQLEPKQVAKSKLTKLMLCVNDLIDTLVNELLHPDFDITT